MTKKKTTKREVIIIHGTRPSPMTKANQCAFRNRIMRFTCTGLLIERMEQEKPLSKNEHQMLTDALAERCSLTANSIFREKVL